MTPPLILNHAELESARQLIQLALQEDLGAIGDLTCQAAIDPKELGVVQVVSRKEGILAGLPIARLVFQSLNPKISCEEHRADSDRLRPGDRIATLKGPVQSLLTGERTALNFLTHLSGIATLTRKYVDAVAGSKAAILDTRKTIPGLRLLQKYAVRAGGGSNHRMGLYDAVMLKDNHLASWAKSETLAHIVPAIRHKIPAGTPIIVEVDRLDQLDDAFRGQPEIILLDNFSLADLATAVQRRKASLSTALLEASGGVNLDTVAAIAQTGVDRISVGAITHSAPALDIGLDWLE